MTIVTLKNWYLIPGTVDPYTPPEYPPACLAGDAYGHPNHENGNHVHTSALRDTRRVVDGKFYKTNNTTYFLDGMCPKYEKWCKENGHL